MEPEPVHTNWGHGPGPAPGNANTQRQLTTKQKLQQFINTELLKSILKQTFLKSAFTTGKGGGGNKKLLKSSDKNVSVHIRVYIIAF